MIDSFIKSLRSLSLATDYTASFPKPEESGWNPPINNYEKSKEKEAQNDRLKIKKIAIDKKLLL